MEGRTHSKVIMKFLLYYTIGVSRSTCVPLPVYNKLFSLLIYQWLSKVGRSCFYHFLWVAPAFSVQLTTTILLFCGNTSDLLSLLMVLIRWGSDFLEVLVNKTVIW